MKENNNDREYILKTIQLSEKSLEKGDAPFACIIVKENKILVKATNDSNTNVSKHAEIIALNKAEDLLKTSNLSNCVLYSNCEPCPMCSFMIREYKIKKIVFSLPSPFMGGFTKYPILQDKELSQFKPYFNTPPKVIGGLLESEAKKIFDKTPLWMFGSNVKK